MGMFDSVWVECPDCKHRIEFQSKAGECCLADYDIHNAPPAILGDITGEREICPHCGRGVKVRVTVFATVE